MPHTVKYSMYLSQCSVQCPQVLLVGALREPGCNINTQKTNAVKVVTVVD